MDDKLELHELLRHEPDLREVLRQRVAEVRRSQTVRRAGWRMARPGTYNARCDVPEAPDEPVEEQAPPIPTSLTNMDKLVLISHGQGMTVADFEAKFGCTRTNAKLWRRQAMTRFGVDDIESAYAIAYEAKLIPWSVGGSKLKKPVRSKA